MIRERPLPGPKDLALVTDRPCVLIAEDVRPMRIAIARMVESLGYQVIVASDGDEALQAYLRRPPEVALLDIGMPGVDGLEVCRRIKIIDPDATVAILTARTDEFTVRRAIDAEAVDYLAKPVALERLETALNRLAPTPTS